MISQSQFNASIIPFTLQYEGGYANVTGDKGGETYRGITRKNWPNWSGWPTVDKVKPAHKQIIPELENAVKAFYYANYFQAKGFHNLNSVKVASALFDFAVHGGFSVKTLQTKLNQSFNAGLPVDGGMGAKTIAAINKADENKLASLIQQWRETHLKSIIERDPSQQKFWAGWSARLNKLTSVLGVIKRNPINTGVVVLIIAAVGLWWYYSNRRMQHESVD